MAGTITATSKSRKGLGIVRLKAAITTDASGNATATVIGSAFGRLVGVVYKPGTLATGATVTISDKDSGAALVTMSNAGTTNRSFRPTAVVTDNTGTAVTAATTAVDVNRDIFVAGGITVAVASGGNALSGNLDVIVQEG